MSSCCFSHKYRNDKVATRLSQAHNTKKKHHNLDKVVTRLCCMLTIWCVKKSLVSSVAMVIVIPPTTTTHVQRGFATIFRLSRRGKTTYRSGPGKVHLHVSNTPGSTFPCYREAVDLSLCQSPMTSEERQWILQDLSLLCHSSS